MKRIERAKAKSSTYAKKNNGHRSFILIKRGDTEAA